MLPHPNDSDPSKRPIEKMTKPAFTFHHLFSTTYSVSLPSGEFLGNVEFDDGLGEGFTFFHSSVKNEGDAAKMVVEIGDSRRAMRV